MGGKRGKTQTGGREASTGFIPGDYSLAVGMPKTEPPNGWKWAKLSDLARLETGHTPSRKFPEYWDGDVCWIGIRDATANHGTTIYDTNQHATELGIENSSARLLPKDTVCLSRTASVGYVIVMGKEMATSQDFVNWVCSDELDHQFLKYVLLSENRSFLRFASGTTHQTIYFPEVKAFHICHPPLPEQKAIAHILGTLDDKIELNRRMNATLEGMAQALFKSWFVDFDPVIDNALAAGNPIPDELADRAEVRRQALADQKTGTTQQGSVDDSTLSDRESIFPAAFQFTEELGWIPEGWESKTNGELFDVRDGTHDSPKKSESGKFLVTSRHITGSTIDYSNAYRISEADFEEVNKRSKVDSYDILLTMIGTVGVPFLVLEEEINFAIKNVGLFKTGSDRTLALYFFTYLKTDYMKNYMESRLAGTTQKYLTLKILRTLPVVVPSPSVLQHFGSEVKPLFERMHRNNETNQTLRTLRDTLLPKLISGELRIEDAERITDLETKEILS